MYNLEKKNLYKIKLKELSDMNFQYENEIKKLDNLIEFKTKGLYLVKSYECFLELFDVHFYQSIKTYDKIENIYKEQYMKLKLNLIKKEIDIIRAEKKIEKIISEINNIKDIIEIKKSNLNNLYFIREDTKEYNITTINEKKYEANIYNIKKINFKFNEIQNKDKIKNSNSKSIVKGRVGANKVILDKVQKNRNSYSYDFLFLKNNKNNNHINFAFFHNKNNSDTTFSSLNDKTIESKDLLNNTF